MFIANIHADDVECSQSQVKLQVKLVKALAIKTKVFNKFRSKGLSKVFCFLAARLFCYKRLLPLFRSESRPSSENQIPFPFPIRFSFGL